MELLLVLPKFGHWVSDINWSNTETAYQVQVDVILTEKRLNSSATPSFLQKFMQINNKGTSALLAFVLRTPLSQCITYHVPVIPKVCPFDDIFVYESQSMFLTDRPLLWTYRKISDINHTSVGK